MPIIKLTASEIGMLWTQYVQNTMTLQFLKYFNETVEDDEIKPVVQFAEEFSSTVNEDMQRIFQEEELLVPDGFSEKDVNKEAPKLFTDDFILMFLGSIGKSGVLAYGASLSASSRGDVRQLFSSCITETTELFNRAVDVGLEKGIYVRTPQVDVPREIEYVEGKKYLSPFNKRSLNTIEISHLFENLKTNSLGEAICAAFAQTTPSNEIVAFMKKGEDISSKHIQTFSHILEGSAIHPPMTSNSLITNSTTQTFSDRLIVFLMNVLSTTGQRNYSAASTASLRYDLVLHYQRLSVEVALYAKDGLDLMIKHGWLEEPPQAPDRNELVAHSSS
ncbi:hypothetical protein GCM10007216_26590 [Thalassobacillus devorans]|uniref:DUF3231 family protein n=1 Tax=Thalassobacillus devorans TaxID=279813 RepID=A0ABQ1PCI7_9BACI|nr:DUF3231 family protein [Thalassobacillus devorans]NIK29160.1 hypothetical protein [Thalassobacillus devorans]GGC94553.1 hypothetical protein GCM10007216_26590 [Thalassobacillus devorans]